MFSSNFENYSNLKSLLKFSWVVDLNIKTIFIGKDQFFKILEQAIVLVV